MALAMMRPTKHPKTATYVVRLAIPQDVREAAERLFGVSAELRANLGTKDHTVAKRLSTDAVAGLQAKLDQARAATIGKRPHAFRRQIAALAGQVYRQRVAADQHDPELHDLHWDIAFELYHAAVPRDDGPELPITPESYQQWRSTS